MNVCKAVAFIFVLSRAQICAKTKDKAHLRHNTAGY